MLLAVDSTIRLDRKEIALRAAFPVLTGASRAEQPPLSDFFELAIGRKDAHSFDLPYPSGQFFLMKVGL